LNLPGCGAEEWWRRFEAAIGAGAEGPGKNGTDDRGPGSADIRGVLESGPEAHVLQGPAEVVLAELISSGEPLFVLTADARRRWRSLGGAVGIARLRGGDAGSVRGLWPGSPSDAVERFAGGLGSGISLSDHTTLAAHPALAGVCPTTVLFDPPASTAETERASAGGTVLRLADPAGLEFAEMASADRHALTARLRVLYRGLRDAGVATGEGLRQVLSGATRGEDADPGCTPEDAAKLLQVLIEAGVARTEGEADARTVGIVSSEKVDLAGSAQFSGQMQIHKEQIEFLRQSNR
jgi:hypothetical protein